VGVFKGVGREDAPIPESDDFTGVKFNLADWL